MRNETLPSWGNTRVVFRLPPSPTTTRFQTFPPFLSYQPLKIDFRSLQDIGKFENRLNDRLIKLDRIESLTIVFNFVAISKKYDFAKRDCWIIALIRVIIIRQSLLRGKKKERKKGKREKK